MSNEILQVLVPVIISLAFSAGLYYLIGNRIFYNRFIEANNPDHPIGDQSPKQQKAYDKESEKLKVKGNGWRNYQQGSWEVRNNLYQSLEELGVQTEIAGAQKFSVLAIWPEHPNLNLKAAQDALYNSGITYTALTGTVTAVDVVDEFSRDGFNALEIGSHGHPLAIMEEGDQGGILLSDGVTPPGWWARLIEVHNLQLTMILTCNSLPIGEAMINAGVETAIVAQGLLQDTEAIKFALHFYKYVASGKSIQTAFDLARLILTREQAAQLRLLTKNSYMTS